jgi:glycine cleavage system regulatory protein
MSSENKDRIAGEIMIKIELVIEKLLEKFKVELNTLVSEIKEETSTGWLSEQLYIGIRVEEKANKAISNLEERLDEISEEIYEVLSDELLGGKLK